MRHTAVNRFAEKQKVAGFAKKIGDHVPTLDPTFSISLILKQ